MPEEIEYEKMLVRRASHDPAAFQALYEHYFDRVYRYVAARVSNPQDTEDVVSDIFLLVMTRLGLPPVFWSNNCSSGAADRCGIVDAGVQSLTVVEDLDIVKTMPCVLAGVK